MACLHIHKEKEIIKLLWRRRFPGDGRGISRGSGNKCQLGSKTWPSPLLHRFSSLYVFSHPILQLYILLVSHLPLRFTVLIREHVLTIVFNQGRAKNIMHGFTRLLPPIFLILHSLFLYVLINSLVIFPPVVHLVFVYTIYSFNPLMIIFNLFNYM